MIYGRNIKLAGIWNLTNELTNYPKENETAELTML